MFFTLNSIFLQIQDMINFTVQYIHLWMHSCISHPYTTSIRVRTCVYLSETGYYSWHICYYHKSFKTKSKHWRAPSTLQMLTPKFCLALQQQLCAPAHAIFRYQVHYDSNLLRAAPWYSEDIATFYCSLSTHTFLETQLELLWDFRISILWQSNWRQTGR